MSNPENLRCIRRDRDYISKLPDNVLCLILSFLPTKTAVKTSILSKRWRHLWTKVPALDFTEKHSYDMKTLFYSELSLERKIAFNSFMDRVLFHNEVSCLQHLWLFLQDADEFYVHLWMNALTRRNFRELDIILRWASRITPSPRLHVSGEKLVVLKLEGEITLSALMFTHLPKIETIHLVLITFSEAAYLRRPLSNCPVIKELGIIRCGGLPELLYVESLTLKSLTITQTRYDRVILASRFVIKTPNVEFLHLEGKLSQYDVLGKICSLIKANLNLEYADNVFDYARAQTLLKKVSGVITLKLNTEMFLKERNFPFFQNLTCLEQNGDAVLSQILQCAPKLKSLIIRFFNPESIFNPEVAPKHLPCLERVEVLWINVEEIIRVLGYILKAASALKEIKINIHNCSVDEEKLVYQGLLRLPRTSPVCQINVV